MSIKALWRKEARQLQSMIWATFILSFLFLPLQVMKQLSDLQEMIQRNGAGAMLSFDLGSIYSFIMAVMAIVIGGVLIGLERNQGYDEFTLSLPYSRSTIYLTKWSVGALALLLSIMINLAIAYLILTLSPISENMTLLGYPNLPLVGNEMIGQSLPSVTDVNTWIGFGIHLILTNLALFTLSLFLGTISGGYLYQVGFSFIFALFPYGFLLLVGYFFEIHNLHISANGYWAEVINQLTLLHSSAFSTLSHIDLSSWPYDVAYILLFLPLGIYLYRRNRVENNGQMLIFPSLQGFFLFGITLSFALLGGMIGSGFAGGQTVRSLPFYYIGALVLGIGAYWFSKRLMNRRSKEK